jgi:DNA-binding NtrC family response regulator
MDVLDRGVENILFVDTDPEPRKLGAFMLRRRGYDVTEARTGADALQLCESGEACPDLLITEILMPGMSGTDLAAKLVAMQPGMRVLYMSRTDYDRVARRREINRELGFLQKPFTMAQISEKVRRALDARRPSAAATSR